MPAIIPTLQRLALAGVSALLLSLALSATVSAGGGCHAPLRTGDGVEVALEAGCFSPTVLHVETGETVTWTNTDGVAHAVTGAQSSFGTYDQLGADESRSFTFEEAGTFPYFCVLHPSMVGAVVVGDAGPGAPVVANLQHVADADSTASVGPAVEAAAPVTAGVDTRAATWGLGGILVGALGTVLGVRVRRR